MGPKLVEKTTSKTNVFKLVFFVVFSGFWVGLGCQNGSQMEALSIIFHTFLAISEKCDFEQPSNGFAIFFKFGNLDFRPERVSFSMFSWMSVLRPPFLDFWTIFGPTWSPNGSQNRSKN